jgi:hypothetical protein
MEEEEKKKKEEERMHWEVVWEGFNARDIVGSDKK